MGQIFSHTSPPPSPVDRATQSIVNAARNAYPTATRRTPLPSPQPLSPTHVAQADDAWDAILRADQSDLERAVIAFLRDWHVNDLLRFVARHHGEPETETRQRFALRYVNDRTWDRYHISRRARLLAGILVDEIDLPGFRFGVALRQWEAIVDDTTELASSERRGRGRDYWVGWDTMRKRIERFINDHGFDRFIECLNETHNQDEELEEALAEVFVIGPHGDITIYNPVYRPPALPLYTAQPFEAVSEDILTWLLGESELHFSASTSLPPRFQPAWRELSPEADPEDDVQSFESIQAAIDRTQLRWREIYLRVLRHIDLFGSEELLKHLLRELSEEDREQWTILNGKDLVAQSRLRRTGASLAALIADHLATRQREARGIEIPRGLMDPPQRSEHGDIAPATATPAPSYNDLRDENHELRDTNVQLEATLQTLTDDVKDFRRQLDDAFLEREPRPCLICGDYLLDENMERGHMRLHRAEINECREKRGLKPYGLESSPPPPRGRRRGASRSRSSERSRLSPYDSEEPPSQKVPHPGGGSKEDKSTTSTKKRKASEGVDESSTPPPTRVTRRRLERVEIPDETAASHSIPSTGASAPPSSMKAGIKGFGKRKVFARKTAHPTRRPPKRPARTGLRSQDT